MSLVICDLSAAKDSLIPDFNDGGLWSVPKKIFPKTNNTGFIDYF